MEIAKTDRRVNELYEYFIINEKNFDRPTAESLIEHPRVKSLLSSLINGETRKRQERSRSPTRQFSAEFNGFLFSGNILSRVAKFHK